MKQHRAVVLRPFFLVVTCLVLMPTAAADESLTGASDRFALPKQLVGGPAEWVTFDGYRGATGSGTSLAILDQRPSVSVRSRLELKTPVTHGLLVGNQLYLVERNDDGDRLSVLDLDEPGAGTMLMELNPAPRGALRLGRMADHLLVAEDGFGLRILQLSHHHDGGSGHHGPVPVGLFALEERVTAVASSLGTIYLATESGLKIVDALIPALPNQAGQLPLDFGVRAIAANGPTLYLLGDGGLRIVDLEQGGKTDVHPDVQGSSMYLAGRRLYVADVELGLAGVDDVSATMATVFITVGDIFFNPAGLVNVFVGDTVTWQKPGTVFPHNVFSCNPAQVACPGASTELFISGGVTTSPFTFSHVFVLVGSNPYLCQAHVFSMQGNINVSAAATPPPGVPDGRGASTPMVVRQISPPGGANLRLDYDPGACAPDADDHNIIFGTRESLPAVPGGIYTPTGGRCDIGTVSPFDWFASPPAPAAADDFLWWLIVADDGSGKEGSWSEHSGGSDRRGPGNNGASNLCLNTDKDLTNACPP